MKIRLPNRSRAFTLVELIIVIAVVGILAAVTAVGVGQWRTKVAQTEIKSDLANLQAGMEDARNRGDAYPTFPEGTEFDGTGSTKDIFTQSENVRIIYGKGNASFYCVDIRSKASPGVYLYLDTTNGNTAAKQGTCDGGEGSTLPSSDQTVFVFDTTAPGCTGTVQLPVSSPTSGGTINWGDGQSEARTASLMAHTYSTPGRYMVTFTGAITQASYYNAVNATNAKCLTKVTQWANNISPTRVNFHNASNLAYVAEPPATVTDMSYMFSGATAFNQPIGSWNMSNVRLIYYMFLNATAFNQPIGNWNTSNVYHMTGVFQGASSFNQPLANWDTSGVQFMASLFQGASAFDQPIGNWNTANVTTMAHMFRSATVFNQAIGNWDTSKVTTMTYMFNGAPAFNQAIGNWNTAAVNNMSYMFTNATAFNQPIGSWNTAAVTTMTYMFYNADAFNQAIGNWSTAAVTTMSYMFYSAAVFNQNIAGWNVTNVATWTSFHVASPLTQANCPTKLW